VDNFIQNSTVATGLFDSLQAEVWVTVFLAHLKPTTEVRCRLVGMSSPQLRLDGPPPERRETNLLGWVDTVSSFPPDSLNYNLPQAE
jgi:hypothetical protein